MTNKVTQVPVPESTDAQPPWEAPVTLSVTPQNPEAAWVAWGNWLVTVPGYDYETNEEYEQYVPMNVTIRDGEPVSDIFENVQEFLKGALALGWKPTTDGKQSVFDIAKPPVQQASAPLPQAVPPPAPRPQPQGAPQAAVARPQPQPQAAPQAGERQPYPNPFTANKLIITSERNTKDNTFYIKYALMGSTFPKYGVRVWPDLLDRVGLVDTNGTVASQWPLGEYAIGNWACTYNYDGGGKPKNVVSMEWIEG